MAKPTYGEGLKLILETEPLLYSKKLQLMQDKKELQKQLDRLNKQISIFAGLKRAIIAQSPHRVKKWEAKLQEAYAYEQNELVAGILHSSDSPSGSKPDPELDNSTGSQENN